MDFSISGFERAALWAGALVDQVPFGLAKAMNDGVTAARDELVTRTWPSHVKVRNQRFMAVALRREFANKRKLEVAIFDRIGRASLTLHDKGGLRRPRGSSIAVPSSALQTRRTGRGVPKGLRPSALPNSVRKGDVIYQRTGGAGKGAKGGAKRGLKLMYVLKPSVEVRADVPFGRDFEAAMRRGVARSFPIHLRAAMATRRR